MASPIEVWKSEDGGVYATRELALEADAKWRDAQLSTIATIKQELESLKSRLTSLEQKPA